MTKIDELKEQIIDLYDCSYMFHLGELIFNYKATPKMEAEFLEEVNKRIDSAYMEDYEKYGIEHEESCERGATYISLCGANIDETSVEEAIYVAKEKGITDIESWLEVLLEKLSTLIERVDKDCETIENEIIDRYHLTYTSCEW